MASEGRAAVLRFSVASCSYNVSTGSIIRITLTARCVENISRLDPYFAVRDRVENQFNTARNPELVIDAEQMVLNGVLAHTQT